MRLPIQMHVQGSLVLTVSVAGGAVEGAALPVLVVQLDILLSQPTPVG